MAVVDQNYESAIAEFGALRDESLEAGNKRHNLYVFQVVATGAILSFCFAGQDNLVAGFALPVVSLQLGTRFFGYGLSIRRIGVYIRDELGSRVPGGFGWDPWKDALPVVSPWLSKRYQYLLAFMGPAVLGWIIGLAGITASDRPGAWVAGSIIVAVVCLAAIAAIFVSWRSHERIAAQIWRSGSSSSS